MATAIRQTSQPVLSGIEQVALNPPAPVHVADPGLPVTVNIPHVA